MGVALGSIALIGMGCPEQGSAIEIWLVNDSAEFSITSAVITNDSDNSQSEELVSGNIAPNTARLVLLTTVEQFAGSTATVDIDGANGVSADTSVMIDEAIANGGIYPIVVKGDSALTYEAEYLPADVSTKMLSTLKPVQAVQ